MKVVEVVNVDFSMRHFLLPLMRGIRARGHEVVGACAEGPLLAEVRAEGFRVEALPFERRVSPFSHLLAFRALLTLLRAEKPDLVHAHMPISGFLTRLAARAAAVPRVAYTCHGFLFNQDGPWLRRGTSLALEWVGGRLTDVFLTVNGEEADDARRLGISRRAVPVGNGRDPMMFRPDPAARARIRAELGTPQDRVVVTAVSRLVRDKGYPELVGAIGVLPEVELWVVGERLATDRGEDLEALFAASGLNRRLRRLGYRHDVPAVLAASDIFVLPSYFEAMPMSVIEAMLTGLPVVASRVRGTREQVADGVTGLLVTPREVAPLAAALSRLASDPGLRVSMGAAGRERAMVLYDESRVVARTLDVLGLQV